MIFRHYTMIANRGAGEALHSELVTLAGLIRLQAGNKGIALYVDADNPDCFIFIESWASLEDHKAAGQALGKEAFAPVLALLAAPPEGRYLELQPVNEPLRSGAAV